MPTETDDQEKKLVNFRLGVEQKQEWEAFVEDSGKYTTLTQLIRDSVEAEMSGDHDNGSSESPAISSDIQDLSDDVDRIKKDVRWLRDQTQDDVDMSDTAQDVFDELVVLPERVGSRPEGLDADRQQLAAIAAITPDEKGDDPNPQTLSAIAKRVGISEDKCADAIEHLQDQFLPVVEVDLQGVTVEDEEHVVLPTEETHYFKEN